MYVGDNWGGSGIEVREVQLRGPDDTIVSMDFAIVGDGAWRTVSLPFHTKFQGQLHQIRLHPAVQAPHVRGASNPNALRTEAHDGKNGGSSSTASGGGGSESNGVFGSVGAAETEVLLGADGANVLRQLDAPPPTKGNAFAFDWIRVVVAPTIMRVEGCQVNWIDRGVKRTSKLLSLRAYISAFIPLYLSFSTRVHNTHSHLSRTLSFCIAMLLGEQILREQKLGSSHRRCSNPLGNDHQRLPSLHYVYASAVGVAFLALRLDLQLLARSSGNDSRQTFGRCAVSALGAHWGRSL